MAASRDCGYFSIAVNITGGIRPAQRSLVKFEAKLENDFRAEFDALKAKHEEVLLDELCEAVGWPKDKAADAVAGAEADRKELLEQDRKGRALRRKQREEAGIDK